MTLATLAELKSRLGIATADTADDTALTALANGVEARMAEYCQRAWLLANYVETFEGPRGEIHLKAFPVVSVSQVLQDAVALESADYVLRKPRGKLLPAWNAEWPDAEIEVTYRGGYVAAGATPGTGETSVAPVLTNALLLQAEFEWKHKDTLGLQSVSQGGMNQSLPATEWLPQVKSVLDLYRRY
jgi:hypothetical protein